MTTKTVIVAALMAAALTGILSTSTMAAYAQRGGIRDRLQEIGVGGAFPFDPFGGGFSQPAPIITDICIPELAIQGKCTLEGSQVQTTIEEVLGQIEEECSNIHVYGICSQPIEAVEEVLRDWHI